MNLNLIDKNALVGGSSQGIGKAAALELAVLGANLTLLARNEQRLQDTLQELDTSKGQKHGYIIADFSDAHALAARIKRRLTENEFVFHILINNTGGPPGGAIVEAEATELLQAYNNHLICNHLLAQTLLPGMKTEGYGRIINIISTSVKEPIPGLGVSNTTRWAVASWAKTWANEVGQYDITVNNVLPGFTATQRLFSIVEARAEKGGISSEEVEQNMRNSVPMRRFAKPSEVGAAVAFLASPAASYINGINLPVDGGRTKSL